MPTVPSDIRCIEDPPPFDISPLRGSSGETENAGQGGPWVHAEGCVRDGEWCERRGPPLTACAVSRSAARSAGQRRDSRPCRSSARAVMNGTSVAGRLGVPGRPRRAPLELTRDDVARDADLDRGGREPVAAEPGRLRRQPARHPLALVAIAGPDRDRAVAAVARGDADGGVGVRHLDDRERQARGRGEARVVGRHAGEDLRRRRTRRARSGRCRCPRRAGRPPSAARRPRAAPRRAPGRRPRPSRAVRPRRDAGRSRRTPPTVRPRRAGPSARPRARRASRAARAAAGRGRGGTRRPGPARARGWSSAARRGGRRAGRSGAAAARRAARRAARITALPASSAAAASSAGSAHGDADGPRSPITPTGECTSRVLRPASSAVRGARRWSASARGPSEASACSPRTAGSSSDSTIWLFGQPVSSASAMASRSSSSSIATAVRRM